MNQSKRQIYNYIEKNNSRVEWILVLKLKPEPFDSQWLNSFGNTFPCVLHHAQECDGKTLNFAGLSVQVWSFLCKFSIPRWALFEPS